MTQPTTGLRTGPGLYPDPLVPKEFGAQLQVPAQTTSFYVLTHVPPGTPAGDYSASLVVQDGVELHEVPFTLHVWRFGWARLTTRTGFYVNTNNLGRSLAGSGLDWNDAEARRRVVLATYGMLAQHGISSLAPLEQPTPAPDGSFNAGAFASPWRRTSTPTASVSRPRGPRGSSPGRGASTAPTAPRARSS